MDWTAWAAEMEPMVERLLRPAASTAAAEAETAAASLLHLLAAAAAACLSGLDLVARKHLGIFPLPNQTLPYYGVTIQ